jgi:hypothetical protein
MLKLDHTKLALTELAKKIIFDARMNLDRRQPHRQNDGTVITKRISTSFDLWRSLQPTPITGDGVKQPLSVEIEMAYYGYFIDQGVSGTEHKTPEKSPYSFRKDTVGPGMQLALFEWMRAKKIRLRDTGTGRFKVGGISSKSYESLSYVIARSIKRKGITNPFNANAEKMPDIIAQALAKDIDAFLK